MQLVGEDSDIRQKILKFWFFWDFWDGNGNKSGNGERALSVYYIRAFSFTTYSP